MFKRIRCFLSKKIFIENSDLLLTRNGKKVPSAVVSTADGTFFLHFDDGDSFCVSLRGSGKSCVPRPIE